MFEKFLHVHIQFLSENFRILTSNIYLNLILTWNKTNRQKCSKNFCMSISNPYQKISEF